MREFLNETTYTGSVSDTSTGLQYMNARYYDPETGRFLTQDTYTGNPYDPWTQHLYAYCGNNPTSMVDPTGHFIWFLIAVVAVGMAGGAAAEGVGDLLDDGQINRPWQNYVSSALWGGVDGITMGAGKALSTVRAFNNASSAWRTANRTVKAITGKTARNTAAKAVKQEAKSASKAVARKAVKQGVESAGKAFKPVNNMKMKTDDALDAASEWLGKGYKDMGKGRFVSADGERAVRIGDADIMG